MSDLFHSGAVKCDETLRNFAIRQRVPPHLPGLRLRHHFQLPSKRPRHLGESCRECTRQFTQQSCHLTTLPIDAKHIISPATNASLSESTSPFFPLYMLEVWSECSIVVTYIGPVCLMVCVCVCVSKKWYEIGVALNVFVSITETHRLQSLPLNYTL